MKKSMKFATALAGAAVVVVGGTAFTDSQTIPSGPTVMGYGETTASGFNATEVDYTYSADNLNLQSVVFKNLDTSIVVANTSAVFTLTGPASPDAINCVVAEVGAAPRTGTSITCTQTTPANALVEEIDGWNLAVTTDTLE